MNVGKFRNGTSISHMDFHSFWVLLEASVHEEKQSCLERLNPVLTEYCWRFRIGTWQGPSLTIKTLGLNSRPVYSVSWKPLWRVCTSGCPQGQDCTHWLVGEVVKFACLPENRIRSLRDSFFEVLFLILRLKFLTVTKKEMLRRVWRIKITGWLYAQGELANYSLASSRPSVTKMSLSKSRITRNRVLFSLPGKWDNWVL